VIAAGVGAANPNVQADGLDGVLYNIQQNFNAATGSGNVPIFVGETGYNVTSDVSDTQRGAVISAVISEIFADTRFSARIGGLNYWVGPGDDGAGGHTFIFTGGRGNWSLLPSGTVLAGVFAALQGNVVSTTQTDAGGNVWRSTGGGSAANNLYGVVWYSDTVAVCGAVTVTLSYAAAATLDCFEFSGNQATRPDGTLTAFGVFAAPSTSWTLASASGARLILAKIALEQNTALTGLSAFPSSWRAQQQSTASGHLIQSVAGYQVVQAGVTVSIGANGTGNLWQIIASDFADSGGLIAGGGVFGGTTQRLNGLVAALTASSAFAATNTELVALASALTASSAVSGAGALAPALAAAIVANSAFAATLLSLVVLGPTVSTGSALLPATSPDPAVVAAGRQPVTSTSPL
jgi:hypothetical protein